MEAKCNFHLAYLGHCIIELIKRDTPFQTCTESDTVTSLIIGTLTVEEDHTINKLVYLGLGVGIDNTDRAKMIGDDRSNPSGDNKFQSCQKNPLNLRPHNNQPVIMTSALVVHIDKQIVIQPNAKIV